MELKVNVFDVIGSNSVYVNVWHCLVWPRTGMNELFAELVGRSLVRWKMDVDKLQNWYKQKGGDTSRLRTY